MLQDESIQNIEVEFWGTCSIENTHCVDTKQALFTKRNLSIQLMLEQTIDSAV